MGLGPRRPRTFRALLFLALAPCLLGADALATPVVAPAPDPAAAPAPTPPALTADDSPLRPGDRVCLVGPAVAERMQHHGWLETLVQARLPRYGLVFRNLGFASDSLTVQQRTQGFGSQDEWLDRCDASVVFGFWGQMESYDGRAGLAPFRADLRAWVEHVTATSYDDRAPARVVLFTPPPVEDLSDPLLPDPEGENARLAPYAQVVREVGEALGVPVVDLFAGLADPTAAGPRRGSALDDAADLPRPLTHDGVHMTERGDHALARVAVRALAPEAALDGGAGGATGAAGASGSAGAPARAQDADASSDDAERIAAIRHNVLRKNRLWFDRYRATDGYNVYGGRSSLTYDGVTNYEVLQRELQHLDALCANLDGETHALAAGEELGSALRVPVPPLIPVETNRPGPLPGGRYPFRDGEEAIEAMTPGAGLEVTLFADESRFPELANPVQMAFDTRHRLWVAVWPTYPHWAPDEPMNDKLVIVHDDDGDGRADRTTIFADDLHNPTGFAFWDGGVFVAQCPDILFLKDTDGDDVADVRERVLHGLSSGDTHHSANSFVMGPGGALYFQEGIFHQSQVESIHGPIHNRDGCVWRYEPRTRRVERHIAYGFLNPHGHVFDRWGAEFVTDGTGNVNYFALPFSGRVDHPAKHRGYFPFFQQRSRPAGGTEIVSSAHLPDDMQGDYLIANVIGFQGLFRDHVVRDGSGKGAQAAEPVLFSSDPNFRPVDLEVGPDGALWLLDWHNPLIGHMQHHLRDPNRDGTHGRVYRVSAKGRPLSTPPDIAGEPVDTLVSLLGHPERRVVERVRVELSGRDSGEVVAAARAWVAALDGGDLSDLPAPRRARVETQRQLPRSERERLALEALWLQQQHVVLDEELLQRLLVSPEARVRAAATTVLRRMRRHVTLDHALELLAQRVGDPDSRVRLAAVVALSEFDHPRAAELTLSALSADTDRYLDYALIETLEALAPVWRAALAAGEPLAADDPVGLTWALSRLSADELAGARDGAPVFRERLARHATDTDGLLSAARGLARAQGSTAAAELLGAIDRADAREDGHVDHLLSNLFAALHALPADERGVLAGALRARATDARRAATRKLATVARLHAEGSVEPAWAASLSSVSALVDLLDAAPRVGDERLANALFERALPLLDAPPPELAREAARQGARGRYVRLELPGDDRTLTLAEVEVLSQGDNLALLGTATQQSTNWGGVASRAIDGNTSGRYGDGGQTHCLENQSDPWWELDLGAEHDLDAVVVYNRTESDGSWVSRLDGYVLRVLDDQRRTVWELRAGDAKATPDAHTLAAPGVRLRRAAARCLAELGVRTDEALAILAARFDDPELQPTIVSALGSVPAASWPEDVTSDVGRRLTQLLATSPEGSLHGDAGHALLALADHVSTQLPADDARALHSLARRHGPQVIVLRPVRDALLFDRAEFTVVAGRPVELRFENTDVMPHNVVVAAPGALAEVGLAGEALAADPGAWDRGFVPDLPAVLHATGLVQPGAAESIRFDAPATAADHPYVCTFPGHWVRMNGVMHVVDSWEELESAEQGGTVAQAREPLRPDSEQPARQFVQAWTVDDLADDLTVFMAELEEATEADKTAGAQVMLRGALMAEAASCTLCHAVDGEGGRTGPPFEEIVARHDAASLLRQVLDPSEVIAEGYRSELVFLKDGRVLSGRILAEDGQTLSIQDDPYRDEPSVLRHDEIDERRSSDLSAMPEGLVWTYERVDILSLIAWLDSLREP